MELYYESERYRPPPERRRRSRTSPSANTGRGAAVKRLDHVNVLAADVAASTGMSGRLHRLGFFVDTREEVLRAADLLLDADLPIEPAPSKHPVAQGMFLYVYELGGNRVEVTTGTHFIYDPSTSRWPGPRPSGRGARPGGSRRSRHSTPAGRRT
jgi:catechol 2,3-dioxygenase